MVFRNSASRQVIFGAGGFIGSHVVDRLAAAGHNVVAVDNRALALGPQSDGVERIEADAADQAIVEAILQPGDIVYAFMGGALPDAGRNHPRDQLDQAVGGMLSLLEGCRLRNAGRVMFPSSGGTVYGSHQRRLIDEGHPTDPISAYGVQKLAVEKYLGVYRRLYGLDSVIMRIANPFGPRQDPHKGQGLIAAFAYKALTGEPVEVWGDGEVVRDYLYIDDLIDAIVCLSEYNGSERVFNVGSGRGASVNEIIAALKSLLGPDALDIIWRPARPFDTPVNVLCIDRMKKEAGWTVNTPLDAGISSHINWIRSTILN